MQILWHASRYPADMLIGSAARDPSSNRCGGCSAPPLVANGGADPDLKLKEPAHQNVENSGQEDKESPGAKGSKDMEVDPTIPATGDTVPPSAQPHGT
eukprot:4739245-Amphidinium_carterae.8